MNISQLKLRSEKFDDDDDDDNDDDNNNNNNNKTILLLLLRTLIRHRLQKTLHLKPMLTCFNTSVGLI